MKLNLLSLFIFTLTACFASAAEIKLKVGDRIEVAGNNISCGTAEGKCEYIAGNVYCGYSCEYISGNVYCANKPGEKCEYIAGNVYCGSNCEYIAGNVHCVSGGKASPATPSKP